MLEVRDIVTLKDNKYMVISKVDLEGKFYFYIANIEKNEDFKFCYLDDDYLVEINNQALIQKLIPMFTDQAMAELNNYIKNNQDS